MKFAIVRKAREQEDYETLALGQNKILGETTRVTCQSQQVYTQEIGMDGKTGRSLGTVPVVGTSRWKALTEGL